MKILTQIAILFLFFGMASALTIAWDANTDNTLGYTLYWQEQGSTELFQVDMPGIANTQYVIEDKYLKFDVTYDIWATAYNDRANSENSEVLTATRSVVFSPPVSNLPTVEYDPQAPSKIIINATP